MIAPAPRTLLIDAATLAVLIEQGAVAVFDCDFDLADPQAGRRGYRGGHLPGAHYLDLDEDLAGRATGTNGRHPLPDPECFAARMRSLGVRKGQQVIAYDAAGGPYAARLWWLLRWLGHDAVAVLDGGKQAWVGAGLPLETGDPAAAPAGDFVAAAPDNRRMIDVAGVVQNIATGGLRVIDARSPERFRGDPNPLDPVPGHIPGARNRFFKDNLAADGRFKPAAEIAADFRRAMGVTPPQQVVLQCGSGVTACHNALAMEIAGLPGARLYPGSWSEWIADPARPVERG